ncbi:hypothetical protein BDF21DRAFT_441332 [Thamnidium elegans]|nr:hypothetical protein BDF21DRAFT_441332 [Thamnidium elegans]
MTPTSPPYPPFQPAQLVYDASDPNSMATFAYIYPVSPPFPVQYYAEPTNSYPGSPMLHYQLSPQLHPSSPPFSPNVQYQTSPNHHAFIVPSQQQHFPPLHISSPVLTASNTQPIYIQPIIDFKKHQELLEQEYAHLSQFHPQNIYVRGLATSETDESFLEMCQVYGPIASSKAILDQKTGECKGYGFAMFQDQEDCQVAITHLNAAGYQASLARVGQESFSSRLRSLQDETSTNIYISNLPVHMDEDGLQDLFKPFQTISNRILRDPRSGLSRGVGFARLADRSSASAVIEKFNGHSISGSSAPLQVRFADSPAQKRLKNQTSSKKVPAKNIRDIFPAGFPTRSSMPVTPETMLGIAPSFNSTNGYPHTTAAADSCDVDVLADTINLQLSLNEPVCTLRE